ncbi:MAG: SET domain-containing protein-lysine N-methyltransferase, partial [Cytophagales bacterium]|nr:SET domain-containing protein-lysine N-methyltransferase [Cytophagales bacterium]
GKYVNHSCSPNSTSLLQFDNISVAMRTIEKDEQITEDYYCYYGHFESFGCKCGAKNCRSEIRMENTFDASLRMHLADVVDDILSHKQFLLSIKSKDTSAFSKLLKEQMQPELVLSEVKTDSKIKQERF